MQLPSSWELPESITKRLGARTLGKQRAIVEDGHVLLILHRVPKPDAREPEPIVFWRQPDGTWLHRGPGSGLVALKTHVEEYERAEEKLHAAYDRAETATDFFHVLEEAGPLDRATRNLHAALQTAREGIRGDRELIGLRDEAGEIDRSTELLYNDAKGGLDFAIAKRGEEQAALGRQSLQTGHRLNVLAALFFPLTAIASIFGMGLRSGLDELGPWFFWLVVVASFLLGMGFRSWVLRDVTAVGDDRR